MARKTAQEYVDMYKMTNKFWSSITQSWSECPAYRKKQEIDNNGSLLRPFLPGEGRFWNWEGYMKKRCSKATGEYQELEKEIKEYQERVIAPAVRSFHEKTGISPSSIFPYGNQLVKDISGGYLNSLVLITNGKSDLEDELGFSLERAHHLDGLTWEFDTRLGNSPDSGGKTTVELLLMSGVVGFYGGTHGEHGIYRDGIPAKKAEKVLERV